MAHSHVIGLVLWCSKLVSGLRCSSGISGLGFINRPPVRWIRFQLFIEFQRNIGCFGLCFRTTVTALTQRQNLGILGLEQTPSRVFWPIRSHTNGASGIGPPSIPLVYWPSATTHERSPKLLLFLKKKGDSSLFAPHKTIGTITLLKKKSKKTWSRLGPGITCWIQTSTPTKHNISAFVIPTDFLPKLLCRNRQRRVVGPQMVVCL